VKSILAKLNKTNGIIGSMVVNRDGIIVASDFSIELTESSLAAVASAILAALEGALKRIKMGKFSRFIITGTENKVAMVDAGSAILLVMLDRDINMGLVNLDIKDAAAAVRENSKI
jgi:predicted regulator of Ras-like GTPase activity (Roadblock/LC7/MglB family)